MSKAENATVTLEELLASSLAQNRRAIKAVDREGHHHAAGISYEDFRRTGNISGNAKTDITLTQIS
jgi:hypothetical protein